MKDVTILISSIDEAKAVLTRLGENNCKWFDDNAPVGEKDILYWIKGYIICIDERGRVSYEYKHTITDYKICAETFLKNTARYLQTKPIVEKKKIIVAKKKIKVGDIVERLSGDYHGMVAGDIATVIGTTPSGLELEGLGKGHEKSKFKVVNKNRVEDICWNMLKTAPTLLTNAKPLIDGKKVLMNMALWLYQNDGAFDSKIQWRNAMIRFLGEELRLEMEKIKNAKR